MGKAADPRAEPARRMYEEEGRKLIDIAHILDIPPGTVRRWKSIYGWIGENERSEKETERSVKTSERSVKQGERSVKDILIQKEVDQVMSNEELTDKQRLFCLSYVRCFNATKAAIKAGYSVDTAQSMGYENLRKPVIREEIFRLKQNRLNREMLDEYDILQRYIDIAFADINDFAVIGSDAIRVKRDIDGTIVSEISNTANGVKIKLLDAMKAMDWLSQHMDMLTEEQRARVAVLRKQAEEGNADDSETGVVEIAPAIVEDEGSNEDATCDMDAAAEADTVHAAP